MSFKQLTKVCMGCERHMIFPALKDVRFLCSTCLSSQKVREVCGVHLQDYTKCVRQKLSECGTLQYQVEYEP